MKTSRCKKIKARSPPRKRGPKKSSCKKSMPKRRYKKRCQTKSMRKSPVRRSSVKKCMTGMRKSPPPRGYEIICGRLVKSCGTGKMRNDNGRCVDTPAVRIAKIIERLKNEGKTIVDYDIDMNNYKVLRKLARNNSAGDSEDKQAVWIKRDSCGRPVVNWKQKFLCGDWYINNYTKDGVNEMVEQLAGVLPSDYDYDGDDRQPGGEEAAGFAPEDMEWVWKTSGKCGWPEKVLKKDDSSSLTQPRKSACNKAGKAPKNILPLEEFSE